MPLHHPWTTRRRTRGQVVVARLTAHLTATGGEAGSSPVTAVGSLLIFLGFLFLAVQVTVHLYASSVTAGVALEAASRAARSGAPAATCPGLEAWADDQLQGLGGVTTCRATTSTVSVAVTANSPAATMRLFADLSGLDTIRRSAEIRVETTDVP